MVHFLKSETAATFADYSNKIFIPTSYNSFRIQIESTLFGIVILLKVSKVVLETGVVAFVSRSQHKPRFQKDGRTSLGIQETRRSYFLFLPNICPVLRFQMVKSFLLHQVSMN